MLALLHKQATTTPKVRAAIIDGRWHDSHIPDVDYQFRAADMWRPM